MTVDESRDALGATSADPVGTHGAPSASPVGFGTSAGPPVAVGVDVIEVARVAAVLRRHPERFLSRHFTERERRECADVPYRIAARWAGKEAAAKALGTGIGPVGWHEIEILCTSGGAPKLSLHGAASERATQLRLKAWSVSLSHSREHAMAVVAAIGQ
jgi:holo-[acyl-carrier protein] synthase